MSLNLPVGDDISLVFGVPLLVQPMPGAAQLNPGLARLILARERQGAGVRKSNSGGWHSEETLLSWPEPEIATLRGWIDGAVQRVCRLPFRQHPGPLDIAYRATAWANVNRHGHYNNIHIHAGSHWAIVYYVATGEEEPGHPLNGQLELRDPRPAAGHARLPAFGFGRALTVRPTAGLLVVFPAWLEHWVHPFYGTGARISIAANIDITRFAAPGGAD
jgi:uncharacterized protein (TIGR02466 family)